MTELIARHQAKDDQLTKRFSYQKMTGFPEGKMAKTFCERLASQRIPSAKTCV